MQRIATIFFVLCILALCGGASLGQHLAGSIGGLIGGMPGLIGMVGFLIWLSSEDARMHEYAIEASRNASRTQPYSTRTRGR